MTKPLNPATISEPTGPYSHAVWVDKPGQWLHVSGQIGLTSEGAIPATAADQAQLAWENLLTILAEAGMGVENLVKITTYLTDAADLAQCAEVRLGFLGNARPASTLVIVKQLVKPELKFEIEAVAFRAG